MNLTLTKVRKIMKKLGDTLYDTTYFGDLVDDINAESFPDNIMICSDLILSFSNIKRLPNGLVVCGSLDMQKTSITSLPEDLIVGESLNLSNTKISSLPENFTVCGCLELRASNIKSLPDNLTVAYWIDLSDTPITKLPNNLVVGGCLDLRRTKITRLPNNLVVGGRLDLRETKITSLPDNLYVGGDILLSDGSVAQENIDYRKLQNGDYVPGKYLYANNMLTHVKGKRKITGYTFYRGKINDMNVIFDGKNYARCENFKDGVLKLKSLEEKPPFDGADELPFI